MPFYPLITVFLIFLLEGANHIYLRFFRYFPALRYLTFIGIAFHEYMHAFACLLTGAKIHEIKIHPTHGHVKHDFPTLGMPGMIFIALAPLIGGIFFLYLITSFITGLSPLELQSLSQTLLQSDSIQIFIYEFENIITILIESLKAASPWHIAISLFILLNITATITPSAHDYLNVLYGLVALLVITTVLYLFPFSYLRLTLDFIFLQIIVMLVFTLLIFLILLFILSILIILSQLIPKKKHV